MDGIGPLEPARDGAPADAAIAPSGRAATQFKPGNPGRPGGARNRRSRIVESLLDGELEEMTRKLMRMAMNGDMTALRLCINRAAPAEKEAPIDFELPRLDTRDDVAEASKRLMAALAEGDVTATAAGRVMSLLIHHLSIIEGGATEEEEEAPPAEPEPARPRQRPNVVFVG